MLSSIATCDPAINRPFGIVGWSESSIRMRDQATAKAFLFFSANLPRCRLLQAQSVLIMWLSLREAAALGGAIAANVEVAAKPTQS